MASRWHQYGINMASTWWCYSSCSYVALSLAQFAPNHPPLMLLLQDWLLWMDLPTKKQKIGNMLYLTLSPISPQTLVSRARLARLHRLALRTGTSPRTCSSCLCRRTAVVRYLSAATYFSMFVALAMLAELLDLAWSNCTACMLDRVIF